MGAEGIWRRLRTHRRFFLLRQLRKFLRWAAGRPPVDGFEIGLGSDRHIAGRGGGWPRVALLPWAWNHGFRVAYAIVDLGGGFLGYARFPGGPVIDAIDLVARIAVCAFLSITTRLSPVSSSILTS